MTETITMDPPSVQARLLACDTARFNEEIRAIQLGHVINAIEVPLFPYACHTAFYIRLLHIPKTVTVDYSVELVDSEGILVAATPPVVVRNARKEDQIPGVDAMLDLTYVACVPGILQARLLLNGELFDIHPITIRIRKDSEEG